MNRILTLLLFFFNAHVFTSLQAQNETVSKNTYENQSIISSPYIGSVEMGFLYGKIENSFNNPPTYLASPSVLIFNGFHAHRLFSIGATTGFDFYENILITPIALGIRGTFFNTRISPFYSIDAGYGSSFLSSKSDGERPEGGWFINPVLGMRMRIDNNNAFMFGLGFKRQRADTENTDQWGILTKNRITYNRLSLRMGFMF